MGITSRPLSSILKQNLTLGLSLLRFEILRNPNLSCFDLDRPNASAASTDSRSPTRLSSPSIPPVALAWRATLVNQSLAASHLSTVRPTKTDRLTRNLLHTGIGSFLSPSDIASSRDTWAPDSSPCAETFFRHPPPRCDGCHYWSIAL